jgi:hypothetical protein
MNARSFNPDQEASLIPESIQNQLRKMFWRRVIIWILKD